jgi:hypothetical protein
MGKCGLSSAWLMSLLGFLGLSVGCAQHQDNRFIYVRGTITTPLIRAKDAGTYVLVPDDSLTPKFSIDLAAGDSYGFRKREDDAIVAVAKDKEIELGDRYVPFYYWLKKNDNQGK